MTASGFLLGGLFAAVAGPRSTLQPHPRLIAYTHTRPGLLASESTTSPQDDRTLILTKLFTRALVFGDHLEGDSCSLSLIENLDELDGVLDRCGGGESTLVEFEVLFTVQQLHGAEVGYERIEW